MSEKRSYKVTHRSKPGEPWGKEGEFGTVSCAKPGRGMIPAVAYVEWDGYGTWEKCVDLKPSGFSDWGEVRSNLRYRGM